MFEQLSGVKALGKIRSIRNSWSNKEAGTGEAFVCSVDNQKYIGFGAF